MAADSQDIYRNLSADDYQATPIVVESMCANCEENGETRIMCTSIPYYKAVILVSFECPHYDYKNNEIQSGEAVQEHGTLVVLRVKKPEDLRRQLVKSESDNCRRRSGACSPWAQSGSRKTATAVSHSSSRDCWIPVTEVWLIRDPPQEKDFIEARVAVVGNVDAGKSTLLGVLTHSALDDGRGAARTKLFRHKHEFESGRTSSVGNDILGFDVHGNVVNKPDPHNHNLDWVQIGSDCAKLVTFIDLAGHEKNEKFFHPRFRSENNFTRRSLA